jgi:hypothetical protein
MESVGVLIFFAIVGAFICAKARVAAGAVVFSLVAIVLFIATPVGAGLPQVVSEFLTAVSEAAGPVLSEEPAEGSRAVG